MTAYDSFRLWCVRDHALVTGLGERCVPNLIALQLLLLDRQVRNDGVVVVEEVKARGLAVGHDWILLRELLFLVRLLCLAMTLLLGLWPGLLELLEDLFDGFGWLLLLGVLFLQMYISLQLRAGGVL